jgi:pimeloyl-ACP methyl ester carboxylesterase
VQLRLGDLDVYYEERGSGPPLVLVHGLGGSTETWQEVAGPLAERFRVVSYDLRGLGRSSTPAPSCSFSQLVGDLHGLVEGLSLQPVALVGHSLGGAVALGYAARCPDRVASVVAVSAPSSTPSPQGAHLAERARLARAAGMRTIAGLHVRTALPPAFTAARADAVAAYRRVIEGGDPVGYAALCGVIATLDLSAELGGVRAPVLLVHGELDQIVPLADARETASRIAGARLVMLAGCGHVVPFERPGELVAHVREIVESTI